MQQLSTLIAYITRMDTRFQRYNNVFKRKTYETRVIMSVSVQFHGHGLLLWCIYVDACCIICLINFLPQNPLPLYMI